MQPITGPSGLERRTTTTVGPRARIQRRSPVEPATRGSDVTVDDLTVDRGVPLWHIAAWFVVGAIGWFAIGASMWWATSVIGALV